MKTCKIDGCERKYLAKGYCSLHYYRMRRGETNMSLEYLGHIWNKNDIRVLKANKNKICSIPDCTEEVYAKDLCHVHYNLNLKNGYPSPKIKPIMKCKVDNCPQNAMGKYGLCRYHNERFRKKVNLLRPKGVKGELKKNRLIVLKNAKWICEYCKGKADRVHHRDHTKDNHSIENLAPSCAKCNSKLMQFNPKPRTSKFIRLYGMSASEIAKELNKSVGYIRQLHSQGILKEILIKINIVNEILY